MSVVESRVRRLAGWTAPRWYCLAVAVAWLIRAGTTLADGASFARPGDGWRAVFQLIVVVVVLVGIRGNGPALRATVAVGVTYAVLTGLELLDGHTLFGVIPVDTRDRFVHPGLAIAAAACVLANRRRARRMSIYQDVS